jgi:hypothetical protein
LFVAGGGLAALSSLVVPEAWLFVATLLFVIVPVLATIPYSYVVWRQLRSG